jgi:hypothetical protein
MMTTIISTSVKARGEVAERRSGEEAELGKGDAADGIALGRFATLPLRHFLIWDRFIAT